MNKVLYSHKTDEWRTPIELFNQLNEKYHFTLDPCSTDENCLCDKHYTIKDNGLTKSWKDEIVFCNPPYSKINLWAKKCLYECIGNNAFVVMLVPARTDTKWFHNYVYNFAILNYIKGRLHFSNSTGSAPFPSMLAIYDPEYIKIILDMVNITESLL